MWLNDSASSEQNLPPSFWSVKLTQVFVFRTCSVEVFRLILRIYACMSEYKIWRWCRKYEASDIDGAGFFDFAPFGTARGSSVFVRNTDSTLTFHLNAREHIHIETYVHKIIAHFFVDPSLSSSTFRRNDFTLQCSHTGSSRSLCKLLCEQQFVVAQYSNCPCEPYELLSSKYEPLTDYWESNCHQQYLSKTRGCSLKIVPDLLNTKDLCTHERIAMCSNSHQVSYFSHVSFSSKSRH